MFRITDGKGNHENPCWSPNGLRIAFASDQVGGWDIYTINWDGSGQVRMTKSGSNTAPNWSPRL